MRSQTALWPGLLGMLLVLAAGGRLAGVPIASATEPDLPDTDDTLVILLTPHISGDEVESVDISLTIPAPKAPAGEPFLSMGIVRVMMPGALADPEHLIARDEWGLLPLSMEEDPTDPSDFRQDRRWIPSRATEGDVVIRYPITPRLITPETRPGPLVDFRAEGSGFVGSGHTMLALPIAGWPGRVHISWDLAAMPPGSRGITSLGEGSVLAEVTEQNLYSTFFMAGPVYSHPADGSGDFAAYWLTPPAFDLEGALRWTEEAYRYFSRFFAREEAAFRVFMRTTERFQGGGGGGYSSFIFGTVAGEDRDRDEVRALLAHEAIHNFIGGYGESSSSSSGQQWYSEGATSYYSAILPYRAGLTQLDQVAQEFNDLARRYYTNPRNTLSNEEVTELFFSDKNAQILPYTRGPLYFALVDARMRAASGGTRRVDELIMKFIDGRGEASDPIAYWRSLLAGALGEQGPAEFDAMMSGALPDLPSALLGSCFRAAEQELRHFVPGFRPYQDNAGTTRPGPLTPDSPAELAGLREDDEILNPTALDAAEHAGEGAIVTLEVRRGEDKTRITFAPWTPPTPGKQWVRTSVPEADCDI